MARGQGGGGNSNDGMVTMAIFAALGIMFVVIIWVLFKAPIVLFLYAVDAIQYIPLYIARLLSPYSTYEFMHVLHTLKWILHPIKGGMDGTIDPNSITLENLGYVQADIGKRTWFIYAAITAYFWYRTKNEMHGDGVRRKFTLIGKVFGKKEGVSFMDFQAREWTPARFTRHFNPEDRTPNTEPPLRVMPWIKMNKISLTEADGLDTKKTEIIFKKQIGRRWQGYDKEPFYVRAFLLMCMVSLQYSVKEANTLRLKLDTIFYGNDEADVKKTKIDEVLQDIISKDKEIIPVINEVASKHYYSNTACLGVIGYCGPFAHWNGGQGMLICPPMYQWIMLYDRILFLSLEAHGRFGIASFPEAAGVISHYQLERTMQAAQPEKYAIGAVNSVVEWLEHHSIKDMGRFDAAQANSNRRYRLRKKLVDLEEKKRKKHEAMLETMDADYK